MYVLQCAQTAESRQICAEPEDVEYEPPPIVRLMDPSAFAAGTATALRAATRPIMMRMRFMVSPWEWLCEVQRPYDGARGTSFPALTLEMSGCRQTRAHLAARRSRAEGVVFGTARG